MADRGAVALDAVVAAPEVEIGQSLFIADYRFALVFVAVVAGAFAAGAAAAATG